MRDVEPTLYVYGIAYAAPDDIAETLSDAERRERYLLLGVVGALGDPEDTARTVRTHERTLPERVEERRRLFIATGRQFAPIVLGYARDDHAVNDRIERELGLDRRRLRFDGAAPLVRARLSGAEHLLWRLEPESPAGREVRALLADRRALVLDGHHRFAATGQLRAGGRAAAPLAMLVEHRDRALLLRPWHRVGELRRVGFPDGDWEGAIRRRFADAERWDREPSVAEVVRQLRSLQASGRSGFVVAGARGAWTVRDAPRMGAADDTELLHRWLEDELGGERGAFLYERSPRRAFERVAPPAGGAAPERLAFVLPELSASAIEARAFATGEPLPAKTTMYLPKVAEGVLFATIEAD